MKTKLEIDLILMSEAKEDGVIVDQKNGDLVYTFAVSHFFKEAIEHNMTLEEAVENFDIQTRII